MRSVCGLFCVLAALVCAYAESPNHVAAPLYTSGSIVNAANPNSQTLASNTICTIYGKDLAFGTRAVSPEDIRGGVLPTSLPGTGARVYVNNAPATLLYVSPDQINFVMPQFNPGPVDIRINRDSLIGQPARITLARYSPALFQLDPEYIVAIRADGSLIDRSAPVSAGEVIIVYANGLGPTRPNFEGGEIPRAAAPLADMRSFRVLVAGEAADVLYAGVAPFYAGLYQINLRLPASLPANPEIRVAVADVISPAGVLLHAVSSNPQ